MRTDARTPYTIVVQGHLQDRWIDWFGRITLSREFQAAGDPVTIIEGALDQAELHGIITQLRDLGIRLVSIHRQLEGDILPRSVRKGEEKRDGDDD
jgi:hypothetical protein